MATADGWRRWALVLCSVTLFGCGGGGGGPPSSCLAVQPCGGDLVGTWRFLGSCVADVSTLNAVSQDNCQGAAVLSVGVGVSGLITFNADLTYSAQGWNTARDSTTSFPDSCDGDLSCADHNVSVNTSDGSFSKTTCAGTVDCTCSDSALNAVTESGSYATMGTQFELTGPTGSRTRTYCVEGASLHLVTVSDTGSGAPIILLDDVAARQ